MLAFECGLQGSVGWLLPNTELRIHCSSRKKDLSTNEKVELLYRGPQVMMGYEDNPEANDNIFTDDGFIRTGDIGYIDNNGFVFVLDRAKELIKYKGHQVAPAKLEDVLNHHPAVSDKCLKVMPEIFLMVLQRARQKHDGRGNTDSFCRAEASRQPGSPHGTKDCGLHG
ncbi:hypothetical protein PsorP6_004790 [Peronosclerospora sorghi]|uniref:Uncharacterized protein n=1 Tax=Peronosclerospora sorghi TaxID=230839 RepID=A0ACC0VN81_9STRA|nr:hypothetical protein PsorP6_004790 [Peronosclerospora sorghi]